tara:strand:+ start:46 stop:387 length:342 start_codon:yes stop_codon:yes gene_type:complete
MRNMHNLYKRVFRNMYESKKFQTQKEIDLLNYCKDKTFPKNWIHIHKIIELDKIPRYLASPYVCLILGAWHFSSKKDKIERFHRQISFGCRRGETTFKKMNSWIRSLKKKDWY